MERRSDTGHAGSSSERRGSQTDTGLVGIAIHPDFNKNGQVFVAYTARASDGTFVNRVVRFRELNDVLDQPAVLLEDKAVSAPHRAARIRFGPDGKLYVAFAADAATAQDPTAYGGKILRLNVDGTTPRDNPSYSPILPDDIGVPLAFGWQPATSSRWQIDRDWSNREMLMASRTSGGARSLATTIAPAIDPSGAAFYGSRAITGFNGDLFISALAGRQIQRVRFDPANPAHVVATESVVGSAFGRIGDIAAAQDGTLYFCTSNRGSIESVASDGDDRLARIIDQRVKDPLVKMK